MPKKKILRLIPLGGLGEVGKNMMVVEYGQDMLLIDAGLMFPEEEMLGVDLVLPDYSYVVQNASRLRGIVLTHGHEDHVGALPYLLREVEAPVFGTKLTLGLVAPKLQELHVKNPRLREVTPGRVLKLGVFEIDFLRVNHSIPDGVALAIRTPVGVIVHSGDFKFDYTPIDGRATDFAKFTKYGEEGVLALLSDSTNVEAAGNTISERAVGEALRGIFRDAKQRVVVASFASHIHRIQQIIDVAKETGRKIAVCGRSMVDNVAIARDLGYLKLDDDLLVDIGELENHDPAEMVVLSTGSQGEPLSALAKMASRDHRLVRIVPGDTVIISARPVPGNEKSVSRVIDRLFKCGAEVYYETVSGVHVSGHASQEELKLLMNMVKPKYLIPIHGEYRHLVYHSQIAQSLGMAKDRILVVENGNVVEFQNSNCRVAGKISAGVVFVDGLGVGDIGDVVLRDRRVLSQDGILIVVVTINEQTGELVAGPDIVSRGFVYVKQATDLLDEARARIVTALEKTAAENITDWSVLKMEIRSSLSQFLYDRTRRRPMVLPIVVEV